MGRRETTINPVKVAILIGAEQELEGWELAVLEKLAQSDIVTLAAFVIDRRPGDVPKLPFAFRILSAADNRLFGKHERFALENMFQRFRSVPRIECGDLAHLAGVDIVLSHLRYPAPAAFAEHGVRLWEYNFNASPEFSPEAFGFTEALEADPVTDIALVERHPDGSISPVGHCSCNTKFSAAFNAAYAKGMLPSLVERELRRSTLAPTLQSTSTNSVHLSPSTADCILYTLRLATRLMKRTADVVLKKLGAEPRNWTLLVSQGNALSTGFSDLQELKQHVGVFRADPFLFRRDGQTWVFYEACGHKDGIGRIEVGRIESDDVVDSRELDLGDAHRSFPFVFEHSDGIFMIPETHESDRVEIWKCDQFPDRWSLHATALEGTSPADTVFVDWRGESWLFTNLSAGAFHDHCTELHLYRVDGPDLISVEPHPLNPVVLDTTSARNAGRPFIHDGRLIRPAQINTHGLYGFGLKFLEITDLSMDSYSEREVRSVLPVVDKRTIGCHHFDAADDLFIMDARRAFGAKLLGARPIAVEAI